MNIGEQALKDAALSTLTRYSIELCHLKESLPRHRISGLDFASSPGAQFTVFAHPYGEDESPEEIFDSFMNSQEPECVDDGCKQHKTALSNERRSRRRAVYRREVRATVANSAKEPEALAESGSHSSTACSGNIATGHKNSSNHCKSPACESNMRNESNGEAPARPPNYCQPEFADQQSHRQAPLQSSQDSSEHFGARSKGKECELFEFSSCDDTTQEDTSDKISSGTRKSNHPSPCFRSECAACCAREAKNLRSEHRFKADTNRLHVKRTRPDREEVKSRLRCTDECIEWGDQKLNPSSIKARHVPEHDSYSQSCIDESTPSMTSVSSFSWTSQEPRSCPVLQARSRGIVLGPNNRDNHGSAAQEEGVSGSVPTCRLACDASTAQESFKDLSNHNFFSLRSTSLNSRPSFAFPKKEVFECEELLQGTVRVGLYVKRTRFLRLIGDALLCHRRKRGTCIWAESIVGASVSPHSKRLRLTLKLTTGRAINLHFGTCHATDVWATAIQRASVKES